MAQRPDAAGFLVMADVLLGPLAPWWSRESGTLLAELALQTNIIASGFCNFAHWHKFTGCYPRSLAILWKCDLRKRSLPG
jgi:hypothetical protein